jgi:lysozyme
MTRPVNQAAQDLIQQFEGCVLIPYSDPVGILTVCYGHVIKDGESTTLYTQEQCDNLFQGDLSNAASSIEQLVSTDITDNQFGALVSFVFNLGDAALSSSTLLKKLNAGDIKGAADQFLVWCHAGGVELPGLLRRRRAEMNLFLTPDN